MDSGQFSDVDYGDTDPANWAPNKHVAAIRVMTLAWASGTTSAEDKKLLLPAILNAYNWWANSRPKSSNWWWNQIRIPILLGESMLLLKDQLGMWQPAGWKHVLRHESFRKSKGPPPKRVTGLSESVRNSQDPLLSGQRP